MSFCWEYISKARELTQCDTKIIWHFLVWRYLCRLVASSRHKGVYWLLVSWGDSKLWLLKYYSDVIMCSMASQITSLTTVYSAVYSGADQRKHQSSASLAFARGIHRWSVNSPHNCPITQKMFRFDDVIMHMIDCITALFCACHDNASVVVCA